ncbi:MAG: hypothetical protein INR71_04140, partial [Terriglobus roseus]|nr:hypothetical protein [Terriglobus roseus]
HQHQHQHQHQQAQQMQQQLSQETQRIQQHAQQMSQELQARQVQVQAQAQQTLAPAPMAPQPQAAQHFSPHPMAEAHFQSLALQVPARADRRNSHPLIDPGHSAMELQQSVEGPASAGPYMGVRMQAGLEGMALGYVGHEMGLVNGTGP